MSRLPHETIRARRVNEFIFVFADLAWCQMSFMSWLPCEIIRARQVNEFISFGFCRSCLVSDEFYVMAAL